MTYPMILCTKCRKPVWDAVSPTKCPSCENDLKKVLSAVLDKHLKKLDSSSDPDERARAVSIRERVKKAARAAAWSDDKG